MSLYNLRRVTASPSYTITKFDDDFNVEATYTLTPRGFSYLCDCPANNRTVITRPCRHKLMMSALLTAVDTDRFYDHDTGKFCEPLGDLTRPTADLEGRDALPLVGEAPHAGSSIGSEVEGEAPPSPSPQVIDSPTSLPTLPPTIRRR